MKWTAPRVVNAIAMCLVVGVTALYAPGCTKKAPTEAVPASPAATTQAAPAAAPAIKEQHLSQVDAELRAQQVSNVSYALAIKLDKSSTDFSGKVDINFTFAKSARTLSDKLRIDFHKGTVDQIEVNGQPVAQPQSLYTGNIIALPIEKLIDGENKISITYHHPHSNDGYGFHRFVDPEDKEVYVYTHFEPFNANRFFPCFDQPDLKATYQLEVDAPAHWEVISSRIGVATPGSNEEEKHWSFPVSEKFSTYLISLHAGPFSKWESKAGSIPLRLFARRSLAKYVDHAEWFDLTKRGLQYFPKFFGSPYPYGKYDQVIVPDFNSGAMENVAAVTFTERYVPRSKVTQVVKMRRANTILHEMAHMWFGNLVTMKWWNGLWLNESFASYMAERALAEATQYKGVWQEFYTYTKDWAYSTDNEVTTHPIETDVADTGVAKANFDGITYGKGASALKQLAYLQGDSFKDGLHIYFKRFAGGNTSLSDFINTQAEASKRDLATWQKEWLTTTGMNTVRAEWSCKGTGAAAKIAAFELVQTPFRDNAVLRSHRTKVALLTGGNGAPVKVYSSEDVEYAAAKTAVPRFVGKPCPSAVYPNYEDYDYVRVSLDEKSSQFVQANIAAVQDTFLRQMLWQTLWEMVLDAELPVRSYIAAVLTNAPREGDAQILGNLLRRVARASAVSFTALTLLPPEHVKAALAEVEQVVKKQMFAAKPGTDIQQLWFEAFLRIAQDPASLTWIRGLLDSSTSLKGFTVGQDHRWNVIQNLARSNFKEIDTIIEAEQKRDGSDSGKKQSYAALSAIPREDSRRVWLARALRQQDQSVYRPSELKSAMFNLLVVWDYAFSRTVLQPYLDALPALAATEDDDFLEELNFSLMAYVCEDEMIDRVGAYTEKHKSTLPEGVVRALRVWKQNLEICRKVRAGHAS